MRVKPSSGAANSAPPSAVPPHSPHSASWSSMQNGKPEGSLSLSAESSKACTMGKVRVPTSLVCQRRRHPPNRQATEVSGKRYSRCTLLGSGSYGEVYQCWDARTQQHVAVKYFVSSGDDTDLPQSVVREISILKRCNHPHIMTVLDTLFGQRFDHTKYTGGFVMPFYSGGDLVRFARDRYGSNTDRSVARPFPVEMLAPLSRQLYEALTYLHQRSIIHRDIKPQNIMIDADGQRVVLCDFGLGRMCNVPLGPTYTAECCTLWYRPPELLLGARSYGVEIDLWSMALVVGEMILGQPVLAGDSEIGQLWTTFKLLGTPTEAVCPNVSRLPEYKDTFPKWDPKDFTDVFSRGGCDAVDFLRRSLVYEPTQRMSAKRALDHPYLAVPVPPAAAPVRRQPVAALRRSTVRLPPAPNKQYPQRRAIARKRPRRPRK